MLTTSLNKVSPFICFVVFCSPSYFIRLDVKFSLNRKHINVMTGNWHFTTYRKQIRSEKYRFIPLAGEGTRSLSVYELLSLITSLPHRCIPTLSLCCAHAAIPFSLLLSNSLRFLHNLETSSFTPRALKQLHKRSDFADRVSYLRPFWSVYVTGY